jgi:hypothetical protein
MHDAMFNKRLETSYKVQQGNPKQLLDVQSSNVASASLP